MWISGGTGDTQWLLGEETDSESPKFHHYRPGLGEVVVVVVVMLPVLSWLGERWLA